MTLIKSPKQYRLQKDVYQIIIIKVLLGGMAEERDITIGEQDCDIQLPNVDKNIERIHCSIITDKCFQFASQLTTPLVLFLSLRYDKISPVRCLAETDSFNLESSPSILYKRCWHLGTYEKVKNIKYTEVLRENSYLFDADTKFHVLTMNKLTKPQTQQNL
ncbi:hypothetical protein pb186bvf_015527 [Paramecium bursaria]